MDLDLSDDQVALRDGIASMLDGRVPIERVRAGFDRAMFDELADAGVFSLRADGFSWADCVVVFEQLGRFCVPGPLVASLLLGDGRIAGLVDRRRADLDRASRRARRLLVLSAARTRARVDPARSRASRRRGRSIRCTPVARVDALPDGRRRSTSTRRTSRCAGSGAHRGAPARPGRPAAPSSRSRTRRSACSSTGRSARSRRSSTCSPTCSRAPRSRAPRCTARARVLDEADRRGRRRPARARRQGRRRRRRDRERQGRDAGVRRHGLHVGGRRAPLPEAGVGARHALRERRSQRRRSCARPRATRAIWDDS